MAEQSRVDPVTFELIKNGLATLCDEMALTVARAAYSTVVRESLDYTTALLTPDGELIAQGRTIALHLGSVISAFEGIRERFGDDMHPGDLFISNDPYAGGGHLPDIYVFKPLFAGGELAAFAGAEAHMCDIGGRVPGSNACDSTEIYQEGLRIPPARLAIRGMPNRTLWDVIQKNVRQPERVFGDIRALLAAISVGERGVAKLVEKYGLARLRFYVDRILDYTERVTREEIAGWPDGEYVFEDAIDDDGMGLGPIPLRVRVTVKGDELEMDFAGSAPQVRAAINNPATFTKASCFFAVRSAMPPYLPSNSGFTRAIRIAIPEGTILNPRPPAAVAGRALTAHRTTDLVIGALAQIVPERMMAADEGGPALITLAGKDGTGNPWILTDIHLGTWGGRHDRDGVDAICADSMSTANTPCEIVELESPLRIRRYGLVEDTAGAGRFRGGLGLVREYEILADETMLQVRSDRVTTRPYGLRGGKPGSPSANLVNPGLSQRPLPSKFMLWLKAGDVYRNQLPGGGGWGDPLDRDPALVRRDVRDEKISVAFAAREHGVVVNPEATAVDEGATGERRAELRAAATRWLDA